MTELGRIYYHEDLAAIGFGVFLIVMAPLLARDEYRKSRGRAPHAKTTWLLFAVAQASLGYALLSTGAAHAWLTVWAGPYDIMPEWVYAAINVSYDVAIAATILGFVIGGVFWILDKRRA